VLWEVRLSQKNGCGASFGAPQHLLFRRFIMKKLFAMILAAVMLLSLAACGEKETKNDGS